MYTLSTRRRCGLLLWLFLPMLTMGQSSASFWRPVANRPAEPPLTSTLTNRVMTVDWESLYLYMQRAADPSQPLKLSLPQADGSYAQYAITPTTIFPHDLAARYPMIQTYRGHGLDDPMARLCLTLGSRGLHAYMWSPSGDQVIETYQIDTRSTYQIYAVKDLIVPNEGLSCGVDADHVSGLEDYLAAHMHEVGEHPAATRNGSGEELYTYRLAISADHSYSEAVSSGPANIPDVLSAIATLVNQLSAFYEREVAVSFQLVSQQDQLIFLDAASDPFSVNSQPSLQILENPAIIDSIIGNNAYDLGHVFTVLSSASSLAGIGFFRAICATGSGQDILDAHKASGASGASAFQPFSPSFTALVYHEVGHQSFATHIFDYCSPGVDPVQRAPISAYEPGSGSSIMSYAGLCGANDIQGDEDNYFNSGNYDFIYDFTRNEAACAVVTQTGNLPPTVAATITGTFLPISTPFELTAVGTDPDGDSLTYCWEQNDRSSVGSPPGSPSGNAPIFRSWPPTTSPTRVFPRLQNLLDNVQSVWEVLPTYSRGLSFRITARDQRPAGGGVTHDEAFFTVSDLAGPFRALFPNQDTTLIEGDILRVSWDPANTQLAPVNCDSVMILLSSDGGFTFPDTLVAGTPNDGEHALFVPNSIGPDHRIKIKSVGNVFFDLSDDPFAIEPAPSPDLNLLAERDSLTICPGTQTTLQLFTVGQGGFSGAIDIIANPPSGMSISISPSNPVAGDTILITLDAGPTIGNATQVLNLVGVGSGVSDFVSVELRTPGGLADVPVLDVGSTGEVGVSPNPILEWLPSTGGISYEVQVATSPSFSFGTVLVNGTGIGQSFYPVLFPLTPGDIYYWRVRALTECGLTDYSSLGAFQVGDCRQYQPEDVPLTLPSFGAIPIVSASTLSISDVGSIADVNLIGLRGTHEEVSELSVSLRKDSGPEITLFRGICATGDQDFDLSFDDEASNLIIPCPPTTEEAYQPLSPLAALDGQALAGDYTLTISDSVNFVGGELQNWGLEICLTGPDAPDVITETLFVAPGQQASVDQAVLQATDAAFGPSDLAFTLATSPSTGELLLAGSPLSAGATFTQAQVNNASLVYEHGGSTDGVDAFALSVQNPNGGWSGLETVEVLITTQVSLLDGISSELRVFPNPTSHTLHIDWQGEVQPLRASLVNLQGQILHAEGSRQPSLTLDVSGYPVGLYLLQVQVGDQLHSQRVMIE